MINEILSVGIDIGTSTTQTVFSKLRMENTAGYFAVPKISIIDKETVFKSPIHKTPMVSREMLNSDKVKELVTKDFEMAGYTPQDTATGAVIITGEAARKENAEAVLDRLSLFAGEFVVSTAGPDLESVVAGKGSGAYKYSLDNLCVAVNLDIGGGTTNVVLFENGETVSRGCFDIGGRQVIYDDNMVVSYVSESASKIADSINLNIKQGQKTDLQELKLLTDKMASLLSDVVSGINSDLLNSICTKTSSKFEAKKPFAVFFSGGVADAVFNQYETEKDYNDIGVLLGKSIQENDLFIKNNIIESTETIRATVVGAGSYTTSVSGSTIFFNKNVFPMKNVPVLKITDSEQENLLKGDCNFLMDKIEWFQKETDEKKFILALKGDSNPSYETIKLLAGAIAKSADKFSSDTLLIAVKNDIAKVLGQTVFSMLKNKKTVVSIDSVNLEQGDYVDMGKPLMDGLVIPIVVKTLIFG